jgi:sulfur-carrier protein
MSGHIDLKLFADLRKFRPGSGPVSIEGPCKIGPLLDRLGIPGKKAAIIMLNNKHATLRDTVSPGDRLAVFPPLGGG